MNKFSKSKFPKATNLVKSNLIMFTLAVLTAFNACKPDEIEPGENGNTTEQTADSIRNFTINTPVEAVPVLDSAKKALNNNKIVTVKSPSETWEMDSSSFLAVLQLMNTPSRAVLEKPKNIKPNANNVAMPRTVYERMNKPKIQKMNDNANYFRMSKFDKENTNFEIGTKIASDTLVLNANDEISTINDLHKETKNLSSKTDKLYIATMDDMINKFGEDNIPNLGLKQSFDVIEGQCALEEITERMKSGKLKYNDGFNPMSKAILFDVLTKIDGFIGRVDNTTDSSMYYSNYDQVMSFKNEQGGNVLRGGINASECKGGGISTWYKFWYFDKKIKENNQLLLSELIEISTKFDYDTARLYGNYTLPCIYTCPIPGVFIDGPLGTILSVFPTIIYDISDPISGGTKNDTNRYIGDTYKLAVGFNKIISR